MMQTKKNDTLQLACPSFIDAGLVFLADVIERIEFNINQKMVDAPIHNNGSEYETDTFKMRAYYWGDAEPWVSQANFSCDGFEVYWYKYLGRGMSMNREIDANNFFKIIDRCVASVEKQWSFELELEDQDYADEDTEST